MTTVSLTLRYLIALAATALSRLSRPPLRPSWGIGDEARARFLRGSWAEVHARPPAEARRRVESVPTLIPTALWRTRRRSDVLGGVPVTWVSLPGTNEPRLLLYAHGGGFTVGSSRSHRDLLARLALATKARVVSVDYRLAPEHPHPAALEDLLAVWRALLVEWAPRQIVLAGDSAGGNLALSLALALRDAGAPLPGGLVLFSPWLDLRCTAASYTENAPYDFLDRGLGERCAAAWAPGRDLADPALSPLLADLRGLPPLYVQGGGAEVLRDEAVALGERARAAGVTATVDVFEDQVHDFQTFGALSGASLEAIARAGEAIQVFAPSPRMALR